MWQYSYTTVQSVFFLFHLHFLLKWLMCNFDPKAQHFVGGLLAWVTRYIVILFSPQHGRDNLECCSSGTVWKSSSCSKQCFFRAGHLLLQQMEIWFTLRTLQFIWFMSTLNRRMFQMKIWCLNQCSFSNLRWIIRICERTG